MVDTNVILLGVVMFTVVVIGLVGIILAARSRLVSSGDVTIQIKLVMINRPSMDHCSKLYWFTMSSNWMK